ncbi:MAG: superoxide dismutase family protein [Actinomycetota bacterium]|nr:superoxide dismutase family protein [Actinomycetota bacterium]
MRRGVPVLAANRRVPGLLLVVLILALGGCTRADEGKTEDTPGGEEPTSTTTPGETVSGVLTSTTLQLTPSRNSGVSGDAILTDTDGGAEVILNVRNLTDQPGGEHIAHIHAGGTCIDDRMGSGVPVEYPLASLTTRADGTASSTTTIANVSVAQLFSEIARYINVHAAKTGGETPSGIACVDLPSERGSIRNPVGGGEDTLGGGNTEPRGGETTVDGSTRPSGGETTVGGGSTRQ